MLLRLSIDNVVVLRHAELEPAAGLTTLTGETGAGKTLVARAVGLLLGADAGSLVGPAAHEAFVEAEFSVEAGFWDRAEVQSLNGLRPEGEETVLLARRIGSDGRTRALAWGRTISKADLRAVAPLLITVAAQHEQRRLLQSSAQRELLDLAGGATHQKLVHTMRATHSAWVKAQVHQAEIEQRAHDADRRQAELADALERIDALDPSVEEEQRLIEQSARLRHRYALISRLGQAGLMLDGSSGEIPEGFVPILEQLSEACAQISEAAQLDDSLAALASRADALRDEVSELSSSVASALGDVMCMEDFDLDEVDDRLDAYTKLKHRFGPSVEELIAAGEVMRAEFYQIEAIEGSRSAAHAATQHAQEAAEVAAQALRLARRRIGAKLAKAVQKHLKSLAIADARFAVTDEPLGKLTAAGADRVSFQLEANPGMGLQPINKAASGGELSRVALALHLSLAELGALRAEADTVFFDEIDAGIGGRVAHAVADKLAGLAAAGTQVVCITHLAQIAAKADAHYVFTKKRGVTGIQRLGDEEAIAGELSRMLGGMEHDQAALDHAKALRS